MTSGLRHVFSSRQFRYPVCVGVPTLLVLLYLLFLAAPTYQSESQLIVRENQEGSASIVPGLAASLLGGGIKSSAEDTHILVAYLQSNTLIDQIDAQLDLRAHYSAPRLDFIRRLRTDAPAEAFYDFYRRHVTLTILPESSIITLNVSAFDPAFAKKFADALVSASETAINQINARMLGAQTALAERELAKTRAELTAARRALLEFQVANNIIDPAGEINTRLVSLAGLDERLVQKRADLRTKEQFLRPDAFEIRTLQQEITALEAQRAQENERLVSPTAQGMAAAAQSYEEVKLTAEFALHAYTAALALDEKAKLDAGRQEKFLLPISPPHLPEDASFPRPFLGTLTAFALFSLIYGIARLIIATIRDHSL